MAVAVHAEPQTCVSSARLPSIVWMSGVSPLMVTTASPICRPARSAIDFGCDAGHLEHGADLADRRPSRRWIAVGSIDFPRGSARHASRWLGPRRRERRLPPSVCAQTHCASVCGPNLDGGDEERARCAGPVATSGSAGRIEPPGDSSRDDLTAHGQRERRDEQRDQHSGQDPAYDRGPPNIRHSFAMGSPAPSTPPAQHVVSDRASGTLSGSRTAAPASTHVRGFPALWNSQTRWPSLLPPTTGSWSP